jgi:hypothetical protein
VAVNNHERITYSRTGSEYVTLDPLLERCNPLIALENSAGLDNSKGFFKNTAPGAKHSNIFSSTVITQLSSYKLLTIMASNGTNGVNSTYALSETHKNVSNLDKGESGMV